VLEIVDHLVSALYEPPPRDLPTSGQQREFRHRASQSAESFWTVVNRAGTLTLPRIEPWHLPTFLYVPAQETVYISDVDGLPEEIAPFHAALMGLPAEQALTEVQACLPFLMAHELTHAFRDQLGLLGVDAWHEEYIANRIAFAYVSQHAPAVAADVVRMCTRILECAPPGDERDMCRGIVDAARHASDGARDYDCTPTQAAWIHAQMLLDIAAAPRDLGELLERWLPWLRFAAAE
jgi:hypothetical protein